MTLLERISDAMQRTMAGPSLSPTEICDLLRDIRPIVERQSPRGEIVVKLSLDTTQAQQELRAFIERLEQMKQADPRA